MAKKKTNRKKPSPLVYLEQACSIEILFSGRLQREPETVRRLAGSRPHQLRCNAMASPLGRRCHGRSRVRQMDGGRRGTTSGAPGRRHRGHLPLGPGVSGPGCHMQTQGIPGTEERHEARE